MKTMSGHEDFKVYVNDVMLNVMQRYVSIDRERESVIERVQRRLRPYLEEGAQNDLSTLKDIMQVCANELPVEKRRAYGEECSERLRSRIPGLYQ